MIEYSDEHGTLRLLLPTQRRCRPMLLRTRFRCPHMYLGYFVSYLGLTAFLQVLLRWGR